MKKIIYTPILLFFLTIISHGTEKEFRPQIEKVITSLIDQRTEPLMSNSQTVNNISYHQMSAEDVMRHDY